MGPRPPALQSHRSSHSPGRRAGKMLASGSEGGTTQRGGSGQDGCYSTHERGRWLLGGSGHPRAARDIPVGDGAGGPHGTPVLTAMPNACWVPALLQLPSWVLSSSSPSPPLRPCLFHTQNKPGTTWQIRSFSLLTLCPASTQILRTVLASGQMDTYPHCHGAPQIQPCFPFLSSLTHQLQLHTGLWLPSAQRSPLIFHSVTF